MIAVNGEYFRTIPNEASGNCLFEAMAYHLGFSVSPDEIRQAISQFYLDFVPNAIYEPDSLLAAIQTALLFDENDDNGLPHYLMIAGDRVWANMTDIYVCSLLYNIDIQLYEKIHGKPLPCLIQTVYCGKRRVRTVSLIFVHNNHFMALENLTKKEYKKDVDDYTIIRCKRKTRRHHAVK
jgi:hypothetical protein